MEERYKQHVEEDHVRCTEPGCSFSGPELALAAHRLKHMRTADGQSVVDSPEEIEAWRVLRRANWPSKANLDKKFDLEGRRQQRGALSNEPPPKPGMLEQLLRSAHGLDRSGGYGWYGGGKCKGKDKSKGKCKGKGKTKGKGKDGKSKGKGKSKGGWNWQPWNEQADGVDNADIGDNVDRTHALVAVALPSMLANCVPLEAPYGGRRAPPPRKWTAGVCKYFEQGFCYHGDNCRYEHVGGSTTGRPAASGVGAQKLDLEQYRLLPSTLANRVCLIGEGPAADGRCVIGSSDMDVSTTVMHRIEPCHPPQHRYRRSGLLRRLLQREVTSYHSAILQCVRYVVATDFFRLERAPVPDRAPRAGPQEEPIEDVDFDDADMMELADALV